MMFSVFIETATCIHGDSQRLFGNKVCSQYIKDDPSKCYYSYYKNFCCASCKSAAANDREGNKIFHLISFVTLTTSVK